nr:hypothetical protein [Tanacetum cinerariifolium]
LPQTNDLLEDCQGGKCGFWGVNLIWTVAQRWGMMNNSGDLICAGVKWRRSWEWCESGGEGWKLGKSGVKGMAGKPVGSEQ